MHHRGPSLLEEHYTTLQACKDELLQEIPQTEDLERLMCSHHFNPSFEIELKLKHSVFVVWSHIPETEFCRNHTLWNKTISVRFASGSCSPVSPWSVARHRPQRLQTIQQSQQLSSPADIYPHRPVSSLLVPKLGNFLNYNSFLFFDDSFCFCQAGLILIIFFFLF